MQILQVRPERATYLYLRPFLLRFSTQASLRAERRPFRYLRNSVLILNYELLIINSISGSTTFFSAFSLSWCSPSKRWHCG